MSKRFVNSNLQRQINIYWFEGCALGQYTVDIYLSLYIFKQTSLIAICCKLYTYSPSRKGRQLRFQTIWFSCRVSMTRLLIINHIYPSNRNCLQKLNPIRLRIHVGCHVTLISIIQISCLIGFFACMFLVDKMIHLTSSAEENKKFQSLWPKVEIWCQRRKNWNRSSSYKWNFDGHRCQSRWKILE